jgi:hypothetical protein
MEHVDDLKTYDPKIYDPPFDDEKKVMSWGMVPNKKSTLSLYEHRNIQKYIYDAKVEKGEIVDDLGNSSEECIHEEDSLDDTTDDDDNNHSEGDTYEDEDVESIGSSECSWNSNEYNFLKENYVGYRDPPHLQNNYIIGLHPYKHVLFLHHDGEVVAYHLNTSRMQNLSWWYACGINRTFPYSPCYIDALPTTKMPYPDGYMHDL